MVTSSMETLSSPKISMLSDSSFPKNIVTSKSCLLYSSQTLKTFSIKVGVRYVYAPTKRQHLITTIAFSINKHNKPKHQTSVPSCPRLALQNTKLERLLICWFTFTGLMHLIFEGYLVCTPNFYDDNSGAFLAEIWKEYSKGDSRYASFNSGVVALELVTAIVWGPTCLLTAYAVATHKSYRYVLQLAVSLGHFYGVTIYYLSAILEGDNISASSFYYYTYYIGSNIPYILVPLLIMIRSWRKICETEHNNNQNL